jgi:hypothetical protein
MSTLQNVALVFLLVLFPGLAPAQAPQSPELPGDVQLLIQSELSHLESADRRIDLRVKEASPESTLRAIAKVAGFVIEVEGKLPRTPKLTASFKDTATRDVLTWFAKQVDVAYRADRGGKLVVFARPVRAPR